MAPIKDPEMLAKLAKARETARRNREARKAALEKEEKPKEVEKPKEEKAVEPQKEVEPQKVEPQKETLVIEPKTKGKKPKKKVVYIDESDSSDSDEIVITRRKRVIQREDISTGPSVNLPPPVQRPTKYTGIEASINSLYQKYYHQ